MNFFSFKSKMRVQNFNGCIKLANMSYGGFFAQYFDPKHINSEKFKFFKNLKKMG